MVYIVSVVYPIKLLLFVLDHVAPRSYYFSLKIILCQTLISACVCSNLHSQDVYLQIDQGSRQFFSVTGQIANIFGFEGCGLPLQLLNTASIL